MNDQPPADDLAEQSSLGSMLISRDAIGAVNEILKPEHHYRPIHAYIHQAINHLVSEGEPVDPVTVSKELQERGHLQKVGGGPYLLTLTQTPPSPGNAAAYAQIVYDRWRQRRIIEAGRRFVELGYTDATSTEEVDELLSKADQEFRELGEPSKNGLMWSQVIDKWRSWQTNTNDIIPTPWPELNYKLHGGIYKGQLCIVGGRPGDGKSISGLNFVADAAEKHHKTTVFSVEMDDMEICSRLLAWGSWSKQGQIFSRRMDADTWAKVEEYIEKHKDMPLEIVDQASITVEQIIAHCRVRRPDAIFVDYAQLVEASNPKVSREQQVAHITRSLKVAAKQLRMAVYVAAQLNRSGVGGKETREPQISDLRESGAAEQDADIVLLLHRPPDREGEIRLIVGKNRNGPTGPITLTFRGALSRIGD